MEKSDWIKKIEATIQEQEKQIYKKDYKFFQLDRLLRVAERIEELSANCQECKTLKKDVDFVSSKVAEFVNGSPSKRRELEKHFDKLMGHLKEKHGIYPVYYFVSLYSFIGLASGTLLGLGLGYLIPDHRLIIGFSGFAIGITIGYLVGNRKDMRARVARKLI